MAFQSFGLDDRLVQGILATGYTTPTEIQSRAIPAALQGKDIIGSAQTGTGKTAAFVLPILHSLAVQEKKPHNIYALILTPTRELAQQIEDAIRQYGRFLQVRTLSVYGGTSIQNQLKKLRGGIDIVIATPGRLLDHLKRKSITLSEVQTLVLDEADRMFDMGFIDDVKTIIKATPETRQTMLFSATISKEIKNLVRDVQKNPEMIEIGERRSPAKSVTQYFYHASEVQKFPLLLHILQNKKLESVLIFSRTKQGADQLSHKLTKASIKAVSIHSDRTQAQRQRALAGFKQGKYPVLVATDVAARGIDVDGISHVINFDIPFYAEDYIHRIGRTGRASATGDAITFVSRSEIRFVKKIEQYTKKRFELLRYPDFDYQQEIEELPVREERRDRRKNRTDRQPRQERPRSFQRSKSRSNEQREKRNFREERSGGFPRRKEERSSSRSFRQKEKPFFRREKPQREKKVHGFDSFIKKHERKTAPQQTFSTLNEPNGDWRKLMEELREGAKEKHRTVKRMVKRKKHQ